MASDETNIAKIELNLDTTNLDESTSSSEQELCLQIDDNLDAERETKSVNSEAKGASTDVTDTGVKVSGDATEANAYDRKKIHDTNDENGGDFLGFVSRFDDAADTKQIKGEKKVVPKVKVAASSVEASSTKVKLPKEKEPSVQQKTEEGNKSVAPVLESSDTSKSLSHDHVVQVFDGGVGSEGEPDDEDTEGHGRKRRKAALHFMERMKRFAAHGSYDYDGYMDLGGKRASADKKDREHVARASYTPNETEKSFPTFSRTTHDSVVADRAPVRSVAARSTPVKYSIKSPTFVEFASCIICDDVAARNITRRYGTRMCRPCYAFLLRMEAMDKLSYDPDGRVQCNLFNGTMAGCGVYIPPEYFQTAYPIRKRCKACWLSRFIERCLNMPYDTKVELMELLPEKMRYDLVRYLPIEELDDVLTDVAGYFWKRMERGKREKPKKLLLIRRDDPFASEIIERIQEIKAGKRRIVQPNAMEPRAYAY